MSTRSNAESHLTPCENNPCRARLWLFGLAYFVMSLILLSSAAWIFAVIRPNLIEESLKLFSYSDRFRLPNTNKFHNQHIIMRYTR